MLVQKQPLMRRKSLGSINTMSSVSKPSSSSSSLWIHLRSVLLIISSPSSHVSSNRRTLTSPWSRKKRKHALLAKQWKSLFDVDGRFSDGGVKFLKKTRTGGVEPSIRMEVWPFLLGMYDVKSSKSERDAIKAKKRYFSLLHGSSFGWTWNGKNLCNPPFNKLTPRREYVELRKKCLQISKCGEKSCELKLELRNNSNKDKENINQVSELHGHMELMEQKEDDCEFNTENTETETLDPNSFDDLEDAKPFLTSMGIKDDELYKHVYSALGNLTPKKIEDFVTWQRIIRLDAIRANAEWVIYSPCQVSVSEEKAHQLAKSVGLKDYDHLEPSRVHHACRLVAILEAYAVYDFEIGYCQGMSDLLSPIISVIKEDHVAFWCFVGFMRRARHNFRLDEVGIRRQLNIVSKIIKCKDSHLYRHLEMLQAEDCFFVYRMVVVLFRKELTFEQTLCLWEVMWADQTAIRAGIIKCAWRWLKLWAPPTEDLLLYAIAASVLQKRRLIIDNYSSMDEIMKECNNMAGHLDIWKLLDDAHDLVVTFHNKI